MKDKNCSWWKKFDWKFWALIITVLLGLYKTVILSDNHIKTLQEIVEKIDGKVNTLEIDVAYIKGILKP